MSLIIDPTYDGFRFSHTRRDVNSPGGKLTMHIVAIARSFEEAEALAGEILPIQGLELIGQGDDVLRAARAVGLRDGQAKAL